MRQYYYYDYDLCSRVRVTCMRAGFPLGSLGMAMKLQATMTAVSKICMVHIPSDTQLHLVLLEQLEQSSEVQMEVQMEEPG